MSSTSPSPSDAAPVSPDPQALAELTGRAMYDNDAASQSLGMRLLHVGPGEARMEMTIRPDMLNGHRTCHGGFIFALADSTFAFACNSHNQVTVASGCTIDYLSPGYAGEVLMAHGVEQSLAGRTGVYDVLVTGRDGRRVALFRGRSHRLNGLVVQTQDAG